MVFTTFNEVITVVMVRFSRMTLAIMMGATLVRRVMASMDRWVLIFIEQVEYQMINYWINEKSMFMKILRMVITKRGTLIKRGWTLNTSPNTRWD